MILQKLLSNIEHTLLDEAISQIDITGLSCDSRHLRHGDLFLCVKGPRFDGHDHAKDALAKGAAAIVVERDLGLPRQILAANTRQCYAICCANFFDNPAQKLHFIGITGTNGKTTCSYLIKHVLDQAGKKTGLIGTIQNIIGDLVIPAKYTTPDPFQLHTLLARMVEAGCEYVVMEVSSHGLDQHRIDGCHFKVAVFTNLTQDHLDYHQTMESYYLAKRKLFDLCETAVINVDDEYGRRLLQEVSCAKQSYSIQDDLADYTAHNIQISAQGSSFAFVGRSMISRMKLQMPGAFSVANAMASAVCCLSLGIDLDTVTEGLTSCSGVTGRTEVLGTFGDVTIMRDYAHTPDGLEKVLTAIREFAKGRIVTLFGCAGNRDRTKRPHMAKAAAALSDFVILTSDNPRDEDAQRIIDDAMPGLVDSGKPYIAIVDRFDAIQWALAHSEPGDILLLAGKGHEDYQVLAGETRYFDEKVIVERLLKEMGH